jgi:hypothetical protein
MIFERPMNDSTIPRLVSSTLTDHLTAMPAVIVTGARQVGKTTLARALTPGTREYFSLDDLEVLGIAQRNPSDLLSGQLPVTLDEVQREPDLLLGVKRAIDEQRIPGRFLLTGSANLLLMQRASESLAGRASYLTLWPMTRREAVGSDPHSAWGQLLSSPPKYWGEVLAAKGHSRQDWRAIALRGGFPTPALHLRSQSDRTIWFDGYVRTYLERDLRELSEVSSLPDFRRLMRAASLRVGQLLNQTELGRDVGSPQPTVRRHLNLLEASYQLIRLPPYSVNRSKRLIKSPKLYWGDTGVALHLSQESAPRGAHLENMVMLDLLSWRDSQQSSPEIFYWRTTTGEEVDFVIEANGQLIPIEVKSTTRPGFKDSANLRLFRSQYQENCKAGLVLHAGDDLKWLAPNILAAPWWTVM